MRTEEMRHARAVSAPPAVPGHDGHEGERCCLRCNEWWPADAEFFYVKKNRDGLDSTCKACRSEERSDREGGQGKSLPLHDEVPTACGKHRRRTPAEIAARLDAAVSGRLASAPASTMDLAIAMGSFGSNPVAATAKSIRRWADSDASSWVGVIQRGRRRFYYDLEASKQLVDAAIRADHVAGREAVRFELGSDGALKIVRRGERTIEIEPRHVARLAALLSEAA